MSFYQILWPSSRPKRCINQHLRLTLVYAILSFATRRIYSLSIRSNHLRCENLKIAAILPAYNSELHIAEALDSVVNQTRCVDEIVVADDASSDNTVAAVKAWSDTSGVAVKTVQLGSNGGAGAARNAAIGATDADVVAMLDSDDIWRPDMVECLSNALETFPEAIAAFGLREYFDESGPSGDYQGMESLKCIAPIIADSQQYLLSTERAYRLNLQSAITSCSAVVVKRQAAEACGLFDPNFRTSQDREFFLRLSRVGPFVFANTPVSLYRLHEENTTRSTNTLKRRLNRVRLLDKLLSQSHVLRLTDEELRLTQSALDGSATEVLYTAGQRGLKAYFEAARELAETKAHVRSSRVPRIFLRACLASIINRF